MIHRDGRYRIGQVLKHRLYGFRGVVFDVDPTFSHTEEWRLSIPEDVRPRKDQPYYHLLAENDHTTYLAYVSQQNLVVDESDKPCRHPQVEQHFSGREASGRYTPSGRILN